MTRHLLPLLAALAVAGPACAAPPSAGPSEEVRIPFAQFGAIRSFHSAGDEIVYLQGNHHLWYRATLNGPCMNLPHALRIGLDTRFNGDVLDNSSSLLVDGESCRIVSLIRSDPPPRRRR